MQIFAARHSLASLICISEQAQPKKSSHAGPKKEKQQHPCSPYG